MVMPRTSLPGHAIAVPLVLLVLTGAVIVLVWWWLGTPTTIGATSGGATRQYPCVSYAPFRPGQSPLVAGTHIDAKQIDEDLAQLSKVTSCIRNYSIEFGLDQIPAIAKKHGMKVLQGIWLSRDRAKNEAQIKGTVALAKQFPQTIEAVIVGNEVLLRGELPAVELADIVRRVKAQVPMPVTYADVWEFWLRNRDLAAAVDFVTVHILPYWEDFPIPAREAAAHVAAIHKKVAAAFPGKDIFIGEVGWPSAGRMREGALPSPINQARVMAETIARARGQHFRLNVIEAYDQPWKRKLEGAVGGHWGLIDAWSRRFKFALGEPVSNHPHWRRQALVGIVLAGMMFAAAFAARRKELPMPGIAWGMVALVAAVAGATIGWAVENVPIESFDLGGWGRSLVMVAVAVVAPIASAAAIAAGKQPPGFAQVLAGAGERVRDPLTLALGLLLIVLTVLAVAAALGLVFDPRYRDFPFAPLTAAVAGYVVLGLGRGGGLFGRAAAETAAAAVLAVSAVYIAFNESFANWQSLWFCAVLVALALTLARVRGVPD
jgi:exo-beta-1,3-glucanase (GH17 family)